LKLSARKIAISGFSEITYDNEHWRLLKRLRMRAIKITKTLEDSQNDPIIYGSIVRGDVSIKSDIDIFIPNPSSSFLMEIALEQSFFHLERRYIVQATPNHAAKAYIDLKDHVCISFPLVKLHAIEIEFYSFGGKATSSMIMKGFRIPGVDKRLMLINPTLRGHFESTVLGQENNAAKVIGISPETIKSRVRVLLQREKIGRTGVFIERELFPDENFEEVLKELADQNPAVRRRLTI
jgi:predicted nucleotidyltransferase